MSSKKTIPLNDFITLQRGFDLPRNDRQDGVIPVVASTGVGGYHNEAKATAPGVVIGRSGSIGGGQYITEDFWPLNTTLWVKDFKGHNPRYVYYLMRSIDFSTFNVGTGVPTLNRNHLSSVDVTVLDEASEIYVTKCLGSLDDKIQLNHQINQTLEEIAQAIFKSWFVDFEPTKAKIAVLDSGGTEEDALLAAMTAISGKNNAELEQFKNVSPEQYDKLKSTAELFPSEMQDSELGEIPNGWSCLSLDQIAHYQNGLALQKHRPENDSEDFLPVVKIAQLRQGYTDGKEKASVSINPACILENGDVVFSWSGSLIVDIWNGGKASLNQHLFRVSSSNFPKWFYYLYTKHHLASFQSIAAAKAVTMGHINRRHLTEALCAVPLDEHLAVFNSTFQSLLDLGSSLVLEAKTLETLRDTLLPRLLSGEIDVSTIAK